MIHFIYIITIAVLQVHRNHYYSVQMKATIHQNYSSVSSESLNSGFGPVTLNSNDASTRIELPDRPSNVTVV
jgi:hypothetical protein